MRSSLIFTRRPPMNTSRCLPGGAPIWDEGERRLMATPAVVAAAFLRKSLRFGMSSPLGSDVRECARLANTQGWDEVNQFDSHSKSAANKPLTTCTDPESCAVDRHRIDSIPFTHTPRTWRPNENCDDDLCNRRSDVPVLCFRVCSILVR